MRTASFILAATLCYFCETHDLVCEIISDSQKRMKNCIVKIIDNVKKSKVGHSL